MPKIMPFNTGAKPYTIAMVGTNDAEVELYGEVVQTRPIDWWTGEPVPGNYIALDEFLRDLGELSSKDNITVHIHSVGGDFYAGLAIYNRLRNLKASITTINDGLAASAGSLIFMAGDNGKRKVHAASNLMIHGVLTFLYGYYNASDLKGEIKTIDAHNKAAIAAYMEATGLDQETVKAAMSKDTYMTGQEAVDAGWADELISDDADAGLSMKLSPDKSYLVVKGHAVAACCFGKLPANVAEMSADEWAEMSTQNNGSEPHNHSAQPAPQVGDNTHQNGGNDMEIKNLEDLRNAHPDLVTQIENAAQVNAVQAERARISAIDEIAASIGDAQMVQDAKYGEKPLTAEQLAYQAMKAHAAAGTQMVTAMQNDANNGGANAVAGGAAPQDNLTDDEQAAALLLGAIPANMKKEGK